MINVNVCVPESQNQAGRCWLDVVCVLKNEQNNRVQGEECHFVMKNGLKAGENFQSTWRLQQAERATNREII